jgi:hypothetical protein
MTGAFPLFDAKIHTGDEATDAAARKKAKDSESAAAEFARYDGRPCMYDFEYRLWQASLAAAKVSPGAAAGSDKTAADRKLKNTPSPTPAEQAPTGDSAENGPMRPLPQPLSERQIVDLRRAVVAAWRKELEEDRGQLG